MKLSLNGVGKKFYREWIFRNANITFSIDNPTVILGPNGSGKSTFLQVAAGAVMATEGSISFPDSDLNAENFYTELSFASPYLELIEEFTLREIIDFHFRFKKIIGGNSVEDVLRVSGLASSADKIFRYFSSGMKQRIKLLIAIMSDTKVLMLDEPCSNLDEEGVDWYAELIKNYSHKRMIIVASNHNEKEYFFCTQKLNITGWK